VEEDMPADTNARAPTAPKGPGGRKNGALDQALSETFPASDPVAMLEPAGAPVERPVVENEVEARQGVTGHNVRYVLAYGIAGTVIAFIIVYLLYNT
jgi:hypothetical protein